MIAPSRRSFLAGAAGVAAFLASPAGASAPSRPAGSPDPMRVAIDVPRDLGVRRVLPVRRSGGDLRSLSVRVEVDWPGRPSRVRPGTAVMLAFDTDETLVPLDVLCPDGVPDGAVSWLSAEGLYGRTAVEVAPWAVDLSASGDWPAIPLRRVFHPSYPRYRRPGDHRLAFWSDLLGGFRANDAGIGPDGRPCWRTRLSHGRVQRTNGEVGIATDPVLHAAWGVRPFRIEEGRRVLVAEKLARPIPYEGKDRWYSGPVLTTETMFVAGHGWIEARLAMEGGRGTWPAFWAKPRGLWPPEEDVMEWACPTGDPALDRPFFTQWWTAPEGRGMAGHQVDVASIMPGFDRRDMHVYALHWTRDVQVWTVDGTVVHSQPNRNVVLAGARPDIRMYLKLNLALGGLGGEPDDAALPARLSVGHVSAYAAP